MNGLLVEQSRKVDVCEERLVQSHRRGKVDGMNGLLVEQSRKVDVCEERLVQSHQSDMNGLLVGQSLKVDETEPQSWLLLFARLVKVEWPVVWSRAAAFVCDERWNAKLAYLEQD